METQREQIMNLCQQIVVAHNEAVEKTDASWKAVWKVYSLINENAPLDAQRFALWDMVNKSHEANRAFLKVNILSFRASMILGYATNMEFRVLYNS